MIRNSLYYRIKPLVPARLRLAVRGWLTRRKRERSRDIWPILPGSERPPPGWPGWPEGKKFAFILTHDVEGEAGVAKCRQLMAVEKRLGFRSSFNFIPEGGYQVPRELREELTAGGFEVGVHDLHHDGKLYRNRKEFAGNASRINHYLKEWDAAGFRSGFMLHNLDWLKDLDIQYDASTFDTDPFEPQPDASGTIFPFWRGDATGRGYVELPYTLPQDSTLFLLLAEATPELWLEKTDWIARHGGMALLNVHPDYLCFHGGSPGFRMFPFAHYEDLLKYVRQKYEGQFWHVLPKDVAGYCRRVFAEAINL